MRDKDCEKIKMIALIPVWRRPEIYKYCAERVQFPDWMDVKVVALHSQQDEFLKENIITSKKHGFWLMMADNNPLGAKMNRGIAHCLEYEWDFLINIGSDDVYDLEFFEKAKPHLKQDNYIIGMNEVVIFDVKTERARVLILDEGTSAQVWGGLRLISRLGIESALEKRGFVYTPGYNSGLDTCSQHNIYGRDLSPLIVIDGHYLIDIKGSDNINTFHNCRYITGRHISRQEIEKKYNVSGLYKEC